MASRIFCIVGWGWSLVRRVIWPVRIGALIVLMSAFAFTTVHVTSQPWFCNSCHIMNEFYDSWQASAHGEIDCLKCHTEPGLVNYARAKINGFAQTVDCLVGRVGTKPSAYVADASCLRSGCHDMAKLIDKPLQFGSAEFSHAGHVDRTVNGIRIDCTTCHSSFEGEEHFSVNANVCFTCHFLKDSSTGKHIVQTDCRSCHEVPDKIIEVGMISINHADFASYRVACADSCHRGRIEQASRVDDNSCLMCHNLTADRDRIDSVRLHELHASSHHNKVECFACHGVVAHAPQDAGSISGMMQCTNCHSDMHSIQGRIYGADSHPGGMDSSRILGPMYLTHVACADCHVAAEPVKTRGMTGLGKVARATADACDNCHAEGTGSKFIPFWQGQIRKLHGQVAAKLASLRVRAEVATDDTKKRAMAGRITEAQELLDKVEADGSWGVHNFKYTEALLLKANDVIDGAR